MKENYYQYCGIILEKAHLYFWQCFISDLLPSCLAFNAGFSSTANSFHFGRKIGNVYVSPFTLLLITTCPQLILVLGFLTIAEMASWITCRLYLHWTSALGLVEAQLLPAFLTLPQHTFLWCHLFSLLYISSTTSQWRRISP